MNWSNYIDDLRRISKLTKELSDILEASSNKERTYSIDTVLEKEEALQESQIFSSNYMDLLLEILHRKHDIDGLHYLSDYGLTEKEIATVIDELERWEINLDIFLFDEEKIRAILDLFVEIGVTNIYGIILEAPYLFYDTISSVKWRIDAHANKKELAKLLNEDASNLGLINMG